MAIRHEHAVDVAVPPGEAFALLDDLPRTPEWLEPCTAIERIGTGANAVGDRLIYRYRQGGRSGVMEGEILAREADSVLVCRYEDATMQVVVDFRIAATPGGSRLTHTITLQPKTLATRLLSPLMRLGLPRQTRKAMARIQALLATPAS